MRIRTKIVLGLFIGGAILLAGNARIIQHYQKWTSVEQIHRDYQARLDHLFELQHAVDGLILTLNQYAVKGDPKGQKEFFKNYGTVFQQARISIQTEQKLYDQEDILSLNAQLDEIRQSAAALFAIRNPIGNPEAEKFILQLEASASIAETALNRMIKTLGTRLDDARRRSSMMWSRFFSIIYFMFFLLMIVVLSGLFYIPRMIARPLRLLMQTAKRVGGGDFSQLLDEKRKDEFGTLNKTFNFMLNALKEREGALVGKNLELKKVIEELEETNEKLQLSNEELGSTNEELQISSEELESTNEELNVSNQELETTARDLTQARELLERKNEELKDARDYLDSMIRHTHSGICVIGRDYKIESVNHALEEMMGYTESDLIGSYCYRIFHGASEPCPKCPVEQTFQTGTTTKYHHTHVRNDGTEIILDVATTPLFDKENHVARVLETINDVTKVIRLNRELQDQKDQMSSILMNMAEGVVVIKENHDIEFANDPLKREFGEVVGQKCYQALRGFNSACPGEICSLQEILIKGKMRYEITKKNGDGKYYRMTSAPLKNPDGTLSMIQIRQDVTKQMKFEEERKQYTEQIEQINQHMEKEVEKRTLELSKANTELRVVNDRLKELNREKSDFIDIAVHDLRTPLTSIISYADLLLKYHEESQETRTEFLDIIMKEGFRMKQLINDYLDLSKLESGFVDFQEQEVDIHTLIREILPAFESRIQAKQIRMISKLPSSMPGLNADADRIRQVFVNLIDNAVKYTLAGGEIHIVGEVLEKQRLLRFSIQDSGPGIDEKDQKILFKKFGKAMDRDIRQYQGSGLGLSIVKTIVKHYGGNVWVESRKGEGSCFMFTLPLDRGSVQVQHVISVNGDTTELIRQMGPIWKDYLDQNYICAYFGSPMDIDRMKETLSAQSLNVYELMENEQIIFSPAKEPLLSHGKCDGEHLYECASRFCDRIMQLPWNGLVIARDMTRLIPDEKAKQEIFYFEKKMDDYLKQCRKPIVLICRYHPDHFSEAEISSLSQNHPYRFSEGRIVAGSA